MRRLIAVLVMVALSGCGADQRGTACTVDRGELPSWARTGFSDPHPSMPHVLGESGRITAILFGDPLTSPPLPDRANKILWVAKDPVSAPLTIRAERDDGQVVTREVESGPGPSIVDLPPGCWTLSLRWGGQHDTLALRYAKR